MSKRVKIVTSGTGIEKAANILINQKVSDLIAISFTEMSLSKNGNSKYFDYEYFRELCPVKNKGLLEYLNSVDKNWAMSSLSYVPDVNFYKMILPEKHRNLINNNLNDEDLTGWSKMLSDVTKNRVILKSIILGLWGKAPIKDHILNTLSLDIVIGREPKVTQFFVACPTNKELSLLAELFQECLPNHIIRPLSGGTKITNAIAEKIVKSDIQRCKDQSKDGVVILSRDMGSRSFSVSEIDIVILMFDNGSVSALIQKISRSLTGGVDYYGNEKEQGHVVSLSLDPNRVDAVDVYVVEEAQKNKTKAESFNSSIRRIRKSVNIFVIDDNGDKISLLEKDEYYTELIDKFSFDRLKNSQINLIPLISDDSLRNALLEIRSSELSKKEEKLKQLKDKGKKFLDEKAESTSENSEDSEVEIEKLDIHLLRKAVLTINNSILSIIGIDDSIEDKSKSFRYVLKSIESDSDKTKEFLNLFGINPNVVIRLMDSEVINEQIIDICISRF
jgi:hypothetical protein